MPGGDRTGPMGMGAMTGRGAGLCAGSELPGYANRGPGRGLGTGSGAAFGRGRGFRGHGSGGRGWRCWFYATGLPGWMRFGERAAPYGYPTPDRGSNAEMEKQVLKDHAEALQSELDFVKKRLSEVESGASSAQGGTES
ncbi:MAG: DUF5320 domain-containing protein [Candidatus Eisenbacteria bacterium]